MDVINLLVTEVAEWRHLKKKEYGSSILRDSRKYRASVECSTDCPTHAMSKNKF